MPWFEKFQKYRPGIAICLLASFFYATGGVLAKISTGSVGITNVIAVRFLIQSFLPILPFVRNYSTLTGISVCQFVQVGTSGVFFTIAGVCGLEAFKCIPLSDAVTIFNTQSVIVLIAGSVWLKEKIRFLDILSVVCVVVGVIFVSQPEFLFGASDVPRDPSSAYGYALSAVVSFVTAVTTCIIRKVKDVGTVNIVVVQGILASFTALVCTPIMSDSKDPKNGFEIGILVATGVSYFIARFMVTFALTLESSTTVTVLMTTEVLFSLFYQVALFGNFPNALNVVGIALVISCVATLAMKYQIYKVIDKWKKRQYSSSRAEAKPLLDCKMPRK